MHKAQYKKVGFNITLLKYPIYYENYKKQFNLII